LAVAELESTGYGAAMNFKRLCMPLLLVGLASGCIVPIPEPIYSTCRATSGGDWHAVIERVPRWRGGKPKKPMLVISGKVNLPDGVDATLALGPVEKLDTRVQQILVRTEGIAAATDAPLVSREVRGRFDAGEVESVRIRCGDGIFASIASVAEMAPASN
jgi:hypothetical protein